MLPITLYLPIFRRKGIQRPIWNVSTRLIESLVILRKGYVFTSVCHSVHMGVSASGSGGIYTPRQTPPRKTCRHAPLGRHLEADTPRQTPPLADTHPPDGHCSGRCASYWNAFLFFTCACSPRSWVCVMFKVLRDKREHVDVRA